MEKIIRRFIDCQSVVNIEPFGNGHINGSFRAEVLEKNGPETYFLQRLNHQVFKQPEAVMENIRAVALHLASQNFPLKILAPLPTRNGALLHVDGAGNYWRLFPFFEKTTTHERVETAARAHEAARAFGAFAKALDGMDTARLNVTIPHFHNGLFRLAFFKKTLAAASPDRRAEAEEEIEAILRSEKIFHEIAALHLPARAVHHDTKINNLLFDTETQKPAAVIDLDTVMPGTILSDFGDLVRTATCPAEEDEPDLSKVVFREEIYEALHEGFLSEMGGLLTGAELSNLPKAGKWLTLMQAVRFLTDHLAGDVYYRVKYPGHNLVRTRCQLRLFGSQEIHLLTNSDVAAVSAENTVFAGLGLSGDKSPDYG